MSTPYAVLFAQSNRGDGLSESFRTHAGMGREDALLGLLMVSALVAGLWATSRLLGLRRRRRGYHNPWQLFWALCKAHGLNWSDRSLLGRLARHHRLRDPARLFLEAQRWDEQSLGPAFALEFVRLRTLRKQIFDGAARSPGALSTGRAPAERAPLRSDDRPAGAEGRRSAEERPTIALQQPSHATTIAAAPPLLPSSPVPTLDVPPWTEAPQAGS